MPARTDSAVVIGGSFQGCLAAEVLSRTFTQVTILEKGEFDEAQRPRRAVPQENHVHLFLLRGKQILEELFPGILAELEQAGAVVADLGHEVKCYQYGRWKNRFKTGITAHYCSRGLIDSRLRRRILHNPRITIISGAVATALHMSQGRVSAVAFRAGAREQQISVDMAIDASGRGSQSSDWLARCGLQKVREDLIETRLGYASRIYRRLPKYRDLWTVLLVLPRPPHERCMGVISPIEGDRWLVTTGGWFGNFPKPQPEEFERQLTRLPVPDICEVVSQAEPQSNVFGFGMKGSLRRRYELLTTWPDGFLVMGDALCSMNPLYSQGMALCSLEADRLREWLPHLMSGTISTHDVQRRIIEVIGPAWNMAELEDKRFPETSGVRSARMRMRQWYGLRIGLLSASHRKTLRTQIGVTNLVTAPKALYEPRVVGRVVLDSLADATFGGPRP
jgi:2-polyprenyl-6-methoxyphenol hydroxylase-like FAD-dependent oxidoreductase